MSKETWLEAEEELFCELERNPTPQEIAERTIQLEARRIDQLYERIRWG